MAFRGRLQTGGQGSPLQRPMCSKRNFHKEVIVRTDARADEVRDIVKRVFSGYFQQHRTRETVLQSREARRASTGMRTDGKVLAGTFPRLYEPEEEADLDLPEIDETILIDRGRYVARSYRTEGYMAMWLVAVGIVQFYDEGGQMLATINLFTSLRPQKMAA